MSDANTLGNVPQLPQIGHSELPCLLLLFGDESSCESVHLKVFTPTGLFGLFICKSNSFSDERLCMRTRFETGPQGNSLTKVTSVAKAKPQVTLG